MDSTANNDNSNPAEAYGQNLGGNTQHAAGALDFDANIDVLNPENSEGYLPPPDTISPSVPAHASYEPGAIDKNNYSSIAARSLDSQSFDASPHFTWLPEASNSHSADIVSSGGIVDIENTVRDISQPSLHPSDTMMGSLQPCASATYHQPYAYANNNQSMVLAHNNPLYLAPFNADSFHSIPPGLEPSFDMGNISFPQDAANLDSNYIGEQWTHPADSQSDFEMLGANNMLLHPYPAGAGTLQMLPGPYAGPASSQMLGPFDQYRAPQPMQIYTPDENAQLLHGVSSIHDPGYAESVGLLPAISQSVYPNDPRRTGIPEANDQPTVLGNLPHIQPPESFDYTDSFMAPEFYNVPLNGQDALYDPSGDIFPIMQQPTGFAGQGGVTSLENHGHSVYTVGSSTTPNHLVSPYPMGDPMLLYAAGAPSMEIALRPLEPITHPLVPSLQVSTDSSVNKPGEAPSIIYGPERPPQKSSRQLSKRSGRIQKPACGSKSLAAQKKPEERVKLALSRLKDRVGMPENSMGFFGTCVPSSAKKRGKGTQKRARKRGTCIRCHIRHLTCDSGEGDCCNNCQKYWATQAGRSTSWKWTRNNWKSLTSAFEEWFQVKFSGISLGSAWKSPGFFNYNPMVADDTWSICIGVVDNLLGENCSTRWVLSSETHTGHLWGYAGQILRYKEGIRLVNPGLGEDLINIEVEFLCRSWRTLFRIEQLYRKVNKDPIASLAYFLVEWECALSYFTAQFGKWALEVITTLLKIALSRLHEQGKHNLKAEPLLCPILNESAAGQALLPEEYHGLVWSKRREPTTICLPHVTCVDPLHHREGCWCGLIFQSVPLRIIRFYGVLHAADDKGSQWRDFVAEHCSWIRDLGDTNIYRMHTNGKYKQYMRSAFRNHLRLVLRAFFYSAQSWQREKILSFTDEELMVDWEMWRRHMFLEVLRITAHQFFTTASNHTRKEILHAAPPQDGILDATLSAFLLIYLERKISALRAQWAEDPLIDALERFRKKEREDGPNLESR